MIFMKQSSDNLIYRLLCLQYSNKYDRLFNLMQPLKFKLYENQVSGKQPKLISNDKTKIMKGHSNQQESFYLFLQTLSIDDPRYHLKQFFPKYYGKISLNERPIIERQQNQSLFDKKQINTWLQHLAQRYPIRNKFNQFIVLENLTQNLNKINALDIKVSFRPKKEKQKTAKNVLSVQKYRIKLNGMQIFCPYSLKENNYFFSKYYLSTLNTEDQIKSSLAFFFYDGKQIQVNAIRDIINQLKLLSMSIKCFQGFQFTSSSVFIAYDPTQISKYTVKFIDFQRIYTKLSDYDAQSNKGIENIIYFLRNIESEPQSYQKIFQSNNSALQSNNFIIPKSKIQQLNQNLLQL